MIFFILWLLCGVITGSVAYSKNRWGFGWFILGCIIGIFGVIWIACLPALEPLEPNKVESKGSYYEVGEKSKTKEEHKQSLTSSFTGFVGWWRGLSKWKRVVGYIFAAFLSLMLLSVFLPGSPNSNRTSLNSSKEVRWTNKNENELYINGYEDESSCQQITEPNLYVHDGVKVKILGDSGFCYKVLFLGGDYKGEEGWLFGRNLRTQPNPVQEAVVEIKERMHIWANEDWTMPGHDRPVLWDTYDQCMEADEIPDREIENNIPVKILDTPSGTELADYECVKIRPLTGNHAGEIFYIGVTHLVD